MKQLRLILFGTLIAIGLTVFAGNNYSILDTPPSSGVGSFNSRTGAVVPATNDYTFAQIGSKPTTASGYGLVLVSGDIPNNAANTSGNAGTSTAFASNPTDCPSNQYATTIDASGNLTCTQVGVSQLSGAASGILTWLATPTSANLAVAITDETGSGLLVFGTSPALSTPVISGGTVDNAIIGGTTRAAASFTSLNINAGATITNGLAVTGGISLNNNFATSVVNIGTGTSTGAVTLGGGANNVVFGSHIQSTGTAPTISGTGCSAGASPAPTDTRGTITVTVGNTTCTVTFATTYATAPVIVASPNLGVSGVQITSRSATAFTLTFGATVTEVAYMVMK